MEQSAVEWLEEKLIEAGLQFTKGEALEIEQAKEMENEQKGYSKKEVLKILENYHREFNLDTFAYSNTCSFTVKEWFEKSKNK